MLNITKNRVDSYLDLSKYKSNSVFAENKGYLFIKRLLGAMAILVLLFLFLPWTQNISGSGFVTTLKLASETTMKSLQLSKRIRGLKMSG